MELVFLCIFTTERCEMKHSKYFQIKTSLWSNRFTFSFSSPRHPVRSYTFKTLNINFYITAINILCLQVLLKFVEKCFLFAFSILTSTCACQNLLSSTLFTWLPWFSKTTELQSNEVMWRCLELYGLGIISWYFQLIV